MPYRRTKSLLQNTSGISMAARLFLFAYLRLCTVLLNSMLQNQGLITTDTLCFSLPFVFVYPQIAFIRYVLSTSLQFRSKENNGLRPAVFYVSFLFMKTVKINKTTST